MTAQLFSSNQGMATLTPAGLEVQDFLEDLFLSWAARCSAREARYPSLIRVADLDTLNYFQNFPHLIMCACTLAPAAREEYSRQGRQAPLSAIPPSDLGEPEYCLPPAACYNVYLGLRGTELNTAQYVTTVATCYRNEAQFRGLERLRGFTMREIICIGSPESVKAHLSDYRELVQIFSEQLGLPVALEQATDPFFDKEGASARAGRIFPTKEELVYRGRLAIGSINYHRRFFGKRCEINIAGQTASTGCVAFGIERWIHALADHFGPDPQKISSALDAARTVTTAVLREDSARAIGS